MARISRRRLAKTAVRLIAEHPKNQSEIVKSIAAYLIVNKQASQLDLLVKDIARELEISEGVLLAEVRSAFDLNEASRLEIIAYLKQATGAKHVELEKTVEPDLLSGMVINTADRELDVSARRKMKQLASLKSGGIK
ncbi:MAG: F0F1 ATP synthase subunit delta [Candidatus Woesebacteria bacterium]|jgi:F0F1-type ATP synthase delta subunit